MILDEVSQEAIDFILEMHHEGYCMTAIMQDLDYNGIERPVVGKGDCIQFWNRSLVGRIINKYVPDPKPGNRKTPKYVENLILTLRFTERLSYKQIAEELSNLGVVNQKNRDWNYEGVKKVVQRYAQRNDTTVAQIKAD